MDLIQKYIIFLLNILILTVNGQVPSFGKCPSLNVVENFETNRFIGEWYEIEKYPFVADVGGRCNSINYTMMPDGDLAVNSMQTNRFTGNKNTMNGQAHSLSKGKLTVHFQTVPVSIDAPYWILETDYKHYAVIYSCRELGSLLSGRMVWILARERYPNLMHLEKAYAVLSRNNISKAYLMRVDQSNCDENIVKT